MGTAGRNQLVQQLLSAGKSRQRLSPGDHGRHLQWVLRKATLKGTCRYSWDCCCTKNPGHEGLRCDARSDGHGTATAKADVSACRICSGSEACEIWSFSTR